MYCSITRTVFSVSASVGRCVATSAIPNMSLSWCMCIHIECENCIQGPKVKYFRICSQYKYCTYYREEGSRSKQLHRNVQEMRQMAPGEMWLWNMHKQRLRGK